MHKKIFLVLIAFLQVLTALAQDNMTNQTVSVVERIPLSPNAASLGKYFEVPVNMATGIPNISIPLYSIQSGNIKIPITLSYHAGGNRVNDLAGWVGVGWNLSPGGTINKSVNGLDDVDAVDNYQISTSYNPQYNYIEGNYYGYTTFGFTSMTEAVDSLIAISNNAYNSSIDAIERFFGRINQGEVDGEADEFRYSTPEGGGSFFYNQQKGKYTTSRINGWEVENIGDPFYLYSNTGMKYTFGVKERTVNPLWERSNGSTLHYLSTGWQLSEIYDRVHDKTVTMNYDLDNTDVAMGYTMSKTYQFQNLAWIYAGETNDELRRKGEDYTVKEILFDEGKIVFVRSTSSRTDGGPKLLTEIQIYNYKNQLVKKFVLAYDIVGGRPFLKSVQEVGTNNVSNPAYQITYNTSLTLPARFSYAQDYWGYYNGKTSNTTMIPSYPNPYSPMIAAADRRVDSNYNQAGIIQSITYPTGGRLSFEFESNRIDTFYCGGLRVKRVINYDSVASKSLITEYEYDGGGSLWAAGVSPIFGFEFTWASQGWSTFYHSVRMNGDPTLPLFPNQGSPIVYTIVSKREVGNGEDHLSKHYFTSLSPEELAIAPTYQNYAGVHYPKSWNSSDYTGLENKTEYYKKSGGSYSLVKKDEATYAFLNGATDHIWNAQSTWYNPLIDYQFWEAPGNDPYSTYPMNLKPSVNAYKFIRDAPVITQRTSTVYTDQGQSVQKTLFEYDKTTGNQKKITTIGSTGDSTITIVKYAADFPLVSTTIGNAIDALKDANMVASPVETITYTKAAVSSDATIRSGLVLEYDNLRIKKVKKLDAGLSLSSFTEVTNGTSGLSIDTHYGRPQEVVVFSDYGKPISVNDNGNKMSYLWNTTNSNMVAQVVNATAADVSYSSFEGDDNTNWVGINAAYLDSSASGVTGRKFYNQSSFSLSKSGLTTSKEYYVTYWSKNGVYTVTGTVTNYPKTLHSVTIGSATWTLYEHLVTGQGSVTVSGSGAIDELRLYPKGAQMATFTYAPLLGISSQCDVSGRVSVYEYDDMGRLKVVRDLQRNVLKKFDYKYATQ